MYTNYLLYSTQTNKIVTIIRFGIANVFYIINNWDKNGPLFLLLTGLVHHVPGLVRAFLFGMTQAAGKEMKLGCSIRQFQKVLKS